MRIEKILQSKFSEYDFIRLFLSFIRLNNETNIDFDNLKYDLYPFYHDQEYQDLFDDITCKEQIEGNYVELTNMIQIAEFSGLLSHKRNNEKRMITITEEESARIISAYSNLYFEKMNMLTKSYLYNQYVRKLKDCRTCQNMSCRVEIDEKPIEDCLGYIHHDSQESVLKKIKR